jgi:serine/threonine-protein kinase
MVAQYLNTNDIGEIDKPLPVASGEVVGDRYRVDDVVGVGGMGAVVSAVHLELGHKVAIKVLLPEAARNREAAARFLMEARATVALRSAHVARAIDVGELPSGLPYIVMEYLDGRDLARVVADDGLPSVEQSIEYLVQACDAVAEAHGLGIVHRDLKPENLFLTTRRNGDPLVKVLDFGISKVAPTALEGKASRAVTKERVLLGSPAYMSPEQVRSSRDVDARTDIWALGAVLYFLLTGVEPFVADSTAEMFVRILQHTPEPPSQLRPGIPAALDRVVMRCLSLERDDRYASVEELAEALAHISPTASTSVLPPGARSSRRRAMPEPPLEEALEEAADVPLRGRSPFVWLFAGLVLAASAVGIAVVRAGAPTSPPLQGASAAGPPPQRRVMPAHAAAESPPERLSAEALSAAPAQPSRSHGPAPTLATGTSAQAPAARAAARP